MTSLPSKEQALDVVEVTHLLSQRGTNELGNFEVQYAHDPIALQALERWEVSSLIHVCWYKYNLTFSGYTLLYVKANMTPLQVTKHCNLSILSN